LSNAGTVPQQLPPKSNASRIARRSEYGYSSVGVPSIASRSNARKQTATRRSRIMDNACVSA
jgi:hypothetical protein